MIYLSLFNVLVFMRAIMDTALRRRAHVYWPLLIGLFLFSAFRFEVGCDWSGYLHQYNVQLRSTLQDAWGRSDPLWWALIEVQQLLGLSYPWMNVLSSAIFFCGAHVFARRQPDPVAFLILIFPVLIINMPMSGIRQGAAIGIMFLAFSAFIDRSLWRFVVWTLLASAFHASAAIFLLLTPFVWGNYSWQRLLLGGFLAIPGAWFLHGSDYAVVAISRYVDTGVDAAGAAFRGAAITLTGIFFIVFLRRLWVRGFPHDYKLAQLGALIMLIVLLVLPFSTVIADRLGYYLIPIQAMIFARIPFLAIQHERPVYIAAPYLGLLALFTVWTQTSDLFRACYLPYQSWLLGLPDIIR